MCHPVEATRYLRIQPTSGEALETSATSASDATGFQPRVPPERMERYRTRTAWALQLDRHHAWP